jgi:rhodanese-related sulfurtransferase
MERSIKPNELKQLKDVIIVDVRREADFAAGPQMIEGAIRKRPEAVEEWAGELPKNRDVVIYCARGGSVSNTVLDNLLSKGIRARLIEGGIEAWKKES